MIAAKHDRQAPCLQFLIHGRVRRHVPRDHFPQMPITMLWRQPRVERTRQISAIDHGQPTLAQLRRQIRHAQGFRAHGRAARARPDIRRYANQCNCLLVHHLLPVSNASGTRSGIRRTWRCKSNHHCYRRK